MKNSIKISIGYLMLCILLVNYVQGYVIEWSMPRSIPKASSFCWRAAMNEVNMPARKNSKIAARSPFVSKEESSGHRKIRRAIPCKENGNLLYVVNRTVDIASNWSITVWEWENPSGVIESFWNDLSGVPIEDERISNHKDYTTTKELQRNREETLDPFGFVLWPGAIVAAMELIRYKHIVENKNVLVLGAGVGVEAQVAARLGATKVVATDIHPTTLTLLKYGTKQSGLDHKIKTQLFDIVSHTQSIRFSDFNLILVADVLYNDYLAGHVARRCQEARSSVSEDTGLSPVILITDSQRFVSDFEHDINQRLKNIGERETYWQKRSISRFTGSGVLLDDDQTYDVNARIMWIGFTPNSYG